MIGFDLDGTIYHMSPVIKYVAKVYFGKDTPNGIIPGYNLSEVYGLTEAQIRELIIKCQEEKWLTPDRLIPGAKEVLEYLVNHQGEPLIIVTARTQTDWVKNFLEVSLDVDPRKISVFHSRSINKGECLYKLGLEYFLDDYWEALLSVQQHGVQPLLFEQEWNLKLPSDRSHAFQMFERIKDWDHMKDFLVKVG
jgi:hypothetical protein